MRTIEKIILLPALIVIFLWQSFALASYAITNSTSLQPIVDEYLAKHKEDQHISTIALTVQCKGLNFSKPYSVFTGTLSKDNFSPTNKDSIFQIGSITKSFVSVVLLQLADDKKYNFSLDDDLAKWFPEYPMWHGIKIKQLLNMTSGIPDYAEDQNFVSSIMSNPYKNWKPEEILTYEVNNPLNFPVGSKWEYSNTNYTLLGLLIRKITGNEPSTEITNRIIKKLDLKNTFYISDQPDKKLADRLVHGYTAIPDTNIFIDTYGFSLSTANTTGAIISTTEDINKYIRMLFTPGKLLTLSQFKQLTTFVSEKTGQPINQPTKDQPNAYGLGIIESFSSQGMQYVYEGSTPGFRFFYTYFPSQNISMSASLNSDKLDDEWKLFDTAFEKIADQCH